MKKIYFIIMICTLFIISVVSSLFVLSGVSFANQNKNTCYVVSKNNQMLNFI